LNTCARELKFKTFRNFVAGLNILMMFLLTAAIYDDVIQISESSLQLVVLNDAVQYTLWKAETPFVT